MSSNDKLVHDLHVSESSKPKKKKRKVVAAASEGLLGPGWERYDATGLVEHYTHPSQVPAHLKKYFWQRERFFSLYNNGCLLDEEGWYSVTPERVANQIAERCRCGTVLDAFCGVGGNSIAFAQTCERVIAIDNSLVRLTLARHNAIVYGVQDRIEFILADFPSWVRSLQSIQSKETGVENGDKTSPSRIPKIDVVFLSPPWGGPSYISTSSNAKPTSGESSTAAEEQHPQFTLDMTAPLPGDELFNLARSITPHVAYYLPRNTDITQVSKLLDPSTDEKIEVEEEWTGAKLKAITCYFGGLAKGQDHLWTG